MSLRVTAAAGEHDLLFLPWDIPLEEWPEDTIVALPRGISRHVVRFVRMSGVVYAVKETVEPIAQREYDLLFELGRRDVPCVDPVGIVAGRTDAARRGPARRDHHAPPAVLAPLPRAVLHHAAPRHDRRASSTRSPCSWCGCTSSASSGATARCRTRSSAATPGRSRRTSSTPRPGRCTTGSATASAQYDLHDRRDQRRRRAARRRGVRAAAPEHRPDRDLASRCASATRRSGTRSPHRSRSASASGTGSTRASAASTTSASTSPSSPSCRRRAARRSA